MIEPWHQPGWWMIIKKNDLRSLMNSRQELPQTDPPSLPMQSSCFWFHFVLHCINTKTSRYSMSHWHRAFKMATVVQNRNIGDNCWLQGWGPWTHAGSQVGDFELAHVARLGTLNSLSKVARLGNLNSCRLPGWGPWTNGWTSGEPHHILRRVQIVFWRD